MTNRDYVNTKKPSSLKLFWNQHGDSVRFWVIVGLIILTSSVYAGKTGDVFFEIGKSMNVSFRIDFKEVTLKGSGLELLTYDSSVGSSGIVKLDCIAGSSQIVKFKTNTAGRIVLRRVASARNFTGITDVYLEQA